MATLRAAPRAGDPDPRPASTAVGYALAGWLGAAAILAGLAGIVAARWLAAVSGFDGLTVGLGFGTALAGLRLVARQPIRATGARHIGTALGIGIAFGLALVLGGALGASLGDHPVVPGLGRPAAQFVPWAAITIVVAAAEEGILRGVLFDRLQASGGAFVAIVVTTLAFGLMHVPLYGWHVVPLDLAVGLGFAGLRLSMRSTIAPAAAHAVADLATWWL